AELREWIAANTNPFAPTRSTSSRTSRARHWPCMVLRNGWPGLKHSPRRRGSCRERSSLWLWLPERTRRISSRHRPGKDRLGQREVSPAGQFQPFVGVIKPSGSWRVRRRRHPREGLEDGQRFTPADLEHDSLMKRLLTARSATTSSLSIRWC